MRVVRAPGPATVARLLALSGLVGTVVGRDERLVGRPFGLTWPLGTWSGRLLWGTAVSGPLVMDGLLVVLAGRRTPPDRTALRAMRALGFVVVLGQCAEPVVFRRASIGTPARIIAASNLGLGLVLMAGSGGEAD